MESISSDLAASRDSLGTEDNRWQGNLMNIIEKTEECEVLRQDLFVGSVSVKFLPRSPRY